MEDTRCMERDRSITEPGKSTWVVLAYRTMNAGTRFENTVTLPAFYVEGQIHTRVEARREAALILGADLPGALVRFDVHRVA